MEHAAEGVKGPREYDARGRQERARRTREATLDRAHALFLAGGYGATTVESIAAAAGVSAATIYKSYGGKAGLVRELCSRAIAGAGPVHAEERSDALHESGDPRAVIAGWGTLAAEVSPRISPLTLLLARAAETDAEAAALLAEVEDARLARMTVNAARLRAHLRSGVTVDQARDVLWLCTAAEFYDLVVMRRGWSHEAFGELVASTIAAALL